MLVKTKESLSRTDAEREFYDDDCSAELKARFADHVLNGVTLLLPNFKKSFTS